MILKDPLRDFKVYIFLNKLQFPFKVENGLEIDLNTYIWHCSERQFYIWLVNEDLQACVSVSSVSLYLSGTGFSQSSG